MFRQSLIASLQANFYDARHLHCAGLLNVRLYLPLICSPFASPAWMSLVGYLAAVFLIYQKGLL
ncbi:hypothetical protein CBP51_14385 [Cellvibrio mixtus]|uniref:Uncharacterized protein n=1 Tax=Cellvibrio mixtus TaxID=39650 RepID=A0A266Q3G6_9GAMM|nr:hypothetical protein CBP51_14385 [Cellvibrio mixtus]